MGAGGERQTHHEASDAIRKGAHGRSVRTARYRCIEGTPLKGDAMPQSDLYDLAHDSKECDNLASGAAREATQERLAEILRDGWSAALPPVAVQGGE